MRRKSFDVIVGVGGLLLTVVLVAAGALLFWAYSFTNRPSPTSSRPRGSPSRPRLLSPRPSRAPRSPRG